MSEEVNWQQLAEGFRLERDDYKCRWWRAHGELMVALGAPMTDRQNTAMKEISEIPDSKILEVLQRTGPFTTIQQIRALIDSPKTEGEETK